MERKMLNKLADLLERFLESEGEEQEVMRSHIIRMGKEYAPGERDGEIKRILMDCADMKSVFSFLLAVAISRKKPGDILSMSKSA